VIPHFPSFSFVFSYRKYTRC